MIPFNLLRDALEDPPEALEDRLESGPPGLFQVGESLGDTAGEVWLDFVNLFVLVAAGVSGLFLLVLWR